jgi:hypothetical protein
MEEAGLLPLQEALLEAGAATGPAWAGILLKVSSAGCLLGALLGAGGHATPRPARHATPFPQDNQKAEALAGWLSTRPTDDELEKGFRRKHLRTSSKTDPIGLAVWLVVDDVPLLQAVSRYDAFAVQNFAPRPTDKPKQVTDEEEGGACAAAAAFWEGVHQDRVEGAGVLQVPGQEATSPAPGAAPPRVPPPAGARLSIDLNPKGRERVWQFYLPDPNEPRSFILQWESQPGDAVAMGGVMAGRAATGSTWHHRRLGEGVSLMLDIRPACKGSIYTGLASRLPPRPPP